MRHPDEKKALPTLAERLNAPSIGQAGLAFLLAILIAYVVGAFSR